jgi:hypothetical protein
MNPISLYLNLAPSQTVVISCYDSFEFSPEEREIFFVNTYICMSVSVKNLEHPFIAF